MLYSICCFVFQKNNRLTYCPSGKRPVLSAQAYGLFNLLIRILIRILKQAKLVLKLQHSHNSLVNQLL